MDLAVFHGNLLHMPVFCTHAFHAHAEGMNHRNQHNAQDRAEYTVNPDPEIPFFILFQKIDLFFIFLRSPVFLPASLLHITQNPCTFRTLRHMLFHQLIRFIAGQSVNIRRKQVPDHITCYLHVFALPF